MKITNAQKGFTMVEMLVVVAIIGMLATMSAQSVLRALDASKAAKTMTAMRQVSDAVINYTATTGKNISGRHRVADLAPKLRAHFGGALPIYDGWGNDLYYMLSEAAADEGSGETGSGGSGSGGSGSGGSGSGGSGSGSGGDGPDLSGTCSEAPTGGGGSGSGSGGDDAGSGSGGSGGGAPPCRSFAFLRTSFRVASFGKDGLPDTTPFMVTGEWVDYSTDLVLQDGQFIQSKW